MKQERKKKPHTQILKIKSAVLLLLELKLCVYLQNFRVYEKTDNNNKNHI